MAQRLGLHYLPGSSCLHRWDARCKLPGLLMITLTLMPGRLPWLIFDSVLFLGLLLIARFPIRSFIRDLRIWMLLLLVLFLFQLFFTPGARFDNLSWLPVSKEGIHLGGITVLRLLLILCYATLFTAVTRPRDLQDALVWLLKPFRFLSGRRIGLMVSLTLRFFALILDQAEEVRWAHQARLGEKIRNPVRKAKFMTLPILRRSILRAEDMTLALAARGYRDDLPLHLPTVPFYAWIPLLLLLGTLLVFPPF